MTRTILGITTGLFAAAAFFVPAAEACISCDYVPSVVHSVPSNSYGHERSAPRRAREVFRESREKRKSRVTESKPEKVEKVQKADKPEQVEKVQKAEKSTPAPVNAQVENSSLAVSTAARDSVPAKTIVPSDRGSEHSTIATAAVADKATGSVEAANAGDTVTRVTPGSNTVTCSRYFPTVGQTLSVPCEH
jgi:cytoskeletal protein RodZ